MNFQEDRITETCMHFLQNRRERLVIREPCTGQSYLLLVKIERTIVNLASQRDRTRNDPEAGTHFRSRDNLISRRGRAEHVRIHLPPVPINVAPYSGEFRTKKRHSKVGSVFQQSIHKTVFTLLKIAEWQTGCFKEIFRINST